MSAVYVRWIEPSSARIESFQILRADLSTDDFLPVTDVPFMKTAANWDGTRFFWIDPDGTGTQFYRIVAYDAFDVAVADTGVFQIRSRPADLSALIRLDSNYGGLDALRFIRTNGTPVPYAKIRIYQTSDYIFGRLDTAVAVSETDEQGRWKWPCFVAPGLSYSIVFDKQSDCNAVVEVVV